MMLKTKSIITKLEKVGLKLDEQGACARGRYLLQVCNNGTSGLAYIAIRDLEDPDRIEVDHRTTRYPSTIKQAIQLMQNQ